MHVVQLGLRIVFTAVWAQLPSVSETRVALRVTFERLSLPLGSSFLIIAPPERSFGPDLQRQRDTTQYKKRLPLKPYRFTTVTSVSYLKRKRQVLTIRQQMKIFSNSFPDLQFEFYYLSF